MATYKQFAAGGGMLRRLAWVCGPEPALVASVLAAYRARTVRDETAVLFGGDAADRDIWDLLLSSPPGERLVIVHAAHKMRDFSPMPALAAGIEGLTVVFVSAADDFERAEAGGKKVLVPHLAAVQAAKVGQLVRCCAPAKSDDQAALVASWWPGADVTLAWQVLTRCGGSLTAAAQACGKAVRAGLPPHRDNLAAVCEAEPGAAFAEPLISGRKADAMQAAQLAGRAETGYGLAILASRLTHLAAIREAQLAGAGPRELAGKTGIGRWLIGQLAPYATRYDTARVSRCREILAMAEAWHRQGASCGIAQSVVAAW